MAQFLQRLGFDLANPFARDAELLAHLFQGAWPAILQAVAQFQNEALASAQGFQLCSSAPTGISSDIGS